MAKGKKAAATEAVADERALRNTGLMLLIEHLEGTGSGEAKLAVVRSLLDPTAKAVNVSRGSRAAAEVRTIIRAVDDAAKALRVRGFDGTAAKAIDFSVSLGLTLTSDGEFAGDEVPDEARVVTTAGTIPIETCPEPEPEAAPEGDAGAVVESEADPEPDAAASDPAGPGADPEGDRVRDLRGDGDGQ